MVSTISRCVQEELLERYRELVSLVAGLECGLEEHSYNYLHTWAAAALGEVDIYVCRDLLYYNIWAQ